MSNLNDPRASVKALLLSLTKTQRLDLIEALANALPETGPDGDEMLDVDQAHAEFGVARKGLKRAADRGELALSRGTRGKLLISRAELRRWLDSRPYKATRKAAPPAEDFDALDAELRRGGLVRIASHMRCTSPTKARVRAHRRCESSRVAYPER